MHQELDDDFNEQLAATVGLRLINAVRQTIIHEIGADHVPTDRMAEWADRFTGLADFNGIAFDAGYFFAQNGSGFSVHGNACVVNKTIAQWMAANGLSGRFSFELDSHGLADELGNVPPEAWPEYMPFRMTFEAKS